jgi:hypothetical protein
VQDVETQVRVATQRNSLNPDLESSHRLIVLIPADSNYGAMTHEVWDLANATGMCVRFLGLCKDEFQELTLRRELIMLSALVQDGRISADVKVEIGANWLDTIKRNYQTGDRIVCFAEQRAGLLHQPLSQILQTNLHAPVHVVHGLCPRKSARSNWFSQVMVWAGSISIILGSAFLQMQITSMAQNWVQTVLLIFSVIGEISIIWGWNSLFT